MTTVEDFAPAKINLTLCVTGRRSDGYHLLDSLVVFADVGDRIVVEDADTLSLAVDGPRAAGVPTDDSNLVMRAARLLPGRGARLTLTKVLPAASGIGGGSSDAAAALRALSRLHGLETPPADSVLSLGADVPVCLFARPVRMTGIGEALEPLAGLPELPAVLVNPGCEVSTPTVFRALEQCDNAAMGPVPAFVDAAGMCDWLAAQRNDLEPAACRVAPIVSDVLAALRDRKSCRLARMSGSGATCFGLFPDRRSADRAADEIRRAHPDWWSVSTTLGRGEPAAGRQRTR